ncbi:MAG: Cell division protein FtsL [Chlorobi bacterium OLB4]|nr:MAG: Cell division protein FtsL [Chlorobi bacterium OLB4]MBV6399609.1 hypothetical protein [Ignavibacteria bacterium]
MFVSIVMIFWVNNIITVNSLSVKNNLLRKEIKQIEQTNNFLVTELEKLKTYDRISKLAGEKLGIKYHENSTSGGETIIVKAN